MPVIPTTVICKRITMPSIMHFYSLVLGSNPRVSILHKNLKTFDPGDLQNHCWRSQFCQLKLGSCLDQGKAAIRNEWSKFGGDLGEWRKPCFSFRIISQFLPQRNICSVFRCFNILENAKSLNYYGCKILWFLKC